MWRRIELVLLLSLALSGLLVWWLVDGIDGLDPSSEQDCNSMSDGIRWAIVTISISLGIIGVWLFCLGHYARRTGQFPPPGSIAFFRASSLEDNAVRLRGLLSVILGVAIAGAGIVLLVMTNEILADLRCSVVS